MATIWRSSSEFHDGRSAGTEVLVSTLEADLEDADEETKTVRLSVPAGTQSGTRIAMDGGVPRLRASGRGQLGVTLLVQTPTRIDEEQADLLRQLAELRDETRPEVTVQKHGRGVFGRLRTPSPASDPAFPARGSCRPVASCRYAGPAGRRGGTARRPGAANPTRRNDFIGDGRGRAVAGQVDEVSKTALTMTVAEQHIAEHLGAATSPSVPQGCAR